MTLLWAPNPFTIAHDCIWQAIDDCHELDHIKKGNRIKHNTCKTLTKHNIQSADFPEIQVLPEGFDGNLSASSSAAKIQLRYLIVTTTDDLGHSCFIAQIQWALLKVLCKIKESAGKKKWCGEKLITKVRLIGENEGIVNSSQLRGHKGWTALFRIELTVCINRQKLCTDISGEELVNDPNFEPGWWIGDWDYGTGTASGSTDLKSPPVLELGKTYRVFIYVRSLSGPINVLGLGTINEPGLHVFELPVTEDCLTIQVSTFTELGYVSIMEIV